MMQKLFMELIAAADFSEVFFGTGGHRATRGRSQVWNPGARFRNKDIRLCLYRSSSIGIAKRNRTHAS
jgi:hypothetical protein